MARASRRRPISVFTLRLRITAAAYRDLGVDDPSLVDVQTLRAQHGIVRTFLDTFTEKDPDPASAHVVEAVRDTIAKFRRDQTQGDLPDVVVKRIRFDDGSGGYRAATWWDKKLNTVWLLSVKKISDFSDEPALYREFGRLHGRNELLPTEDERQLALSDAILTLGLSALHRSLDQARKDARHGNEHWVEAEFESPEGHTCSVGAVYVKVVEEDDGSLTEHTMLVVRNLQVAGIQQPLAAEARAEFASKYGAPMEVVYEIPEGRPRRDIEMPMQQTIEHTVHP